MTLLHQLPILHLEVWGQPALDTTSSITFANPTDNVVMSHGLSGVNLCVLLLLRTPNAHGPESTSPYQTSPGSQSRQGWACLWAFDRAVTSSLHSLPSLALSFLGFLKCHLLRKADCHLQCEQGTLLGIPRNPLPSGSSSGVQCLQPLQSPSEVTELNKMGLD
jgi:hypothetical protein